MKSIVRTLSKRYELLLDDSEFSDRMRGMFKALLENVDTWPLDKTNRWVGFIQGSLWVKGLINIDEERDFTRPLFHTYYNTQKIKIPQSIDVMAPNMTAAKFYVYRNLHKGGFSIKHRGKVIARPESFTLSEAEFRVSMAGQRRARTLKQRNVHAYIVGSEWTNGDLQEFNPTGELYYNPFKTDTFVDSKTLNPIKSLTSVMFVGNIAYYN